MPSYVLMGLFEVSLETVQLLDGSAVPDMRHCGQGKEEHGEKGMM